MARNGRTPEEVRRRIAEEREQLAQAAEALRSELREATDVASRVRGNLPAVTGGAFGVGFVLFGGIGATMRLLARRGREGDVRARVGRYAVVERD